MHYKIKNVMKFWSLLFLVLITMVSIRVRINKIIRVLAFQETETLTEATISWLVLILLCILWVLYFKIY